jgi:hypothetical protein
MIFFLHFADSLLHLFSHTLLTPHTINMEYYNTVYYVILWPWLCAVFWKFRASLQWTDGSSVYPPQSVSYPRHFWHKLWKPHPPKSVYTYGFLMTTDISRNITAVHKYCVHLYLGMTSLNFTESASNSTQNYSAIIKNTSPCYDTTRFVTLTKKVIQLMRKLMWLRYINLWHKYWKNFG